MLIESSLKYRTYLNAVLFQSFIYCFSFIEKEIFILREKTFVLIELQDILYFYMR